MNSGRHLIWGGCSKQGALGHTQIGLSQNKALNLQRPWGLFIEILDRSLLRDLSCLASLGGQRSPDQTRWVALEHVGEAGNNRIGSGSGWALVGFNGVLRSSYLHGMPVCSLLPPDVWGARSILKASGPRLMLRKARQMQDPHQRVVRLYSCCSCTTWL